MPPIPLRPAALVLSVLWALTAAPATADTSPAIVEPLETCFVQPDEDSRAGVGPFDCGYIALPENHDSPGTAVVRLGYVRLPARGPATGAPLFLLAGGPGSTLLKPETFALFSDDLIGPLRADRDVVILEERGSFHSIPALVCPTVARLPWLANRLGLTRDEADTLQEAVVTGCAAQARAAGIDLAQYTSLAIAADIDAARAALGYDRIVYYGASYGAQLGQHLMRERPEILEAVILDGASALSVRSWVQDRVINVEDGVEHLVATCEADARCGAAYDIRALLDRAMALFDDGPIPARYTDPADPGTVIEMALDETDLAMAVFEMQTGQIFLRSLPVMLHMAVAEGRTSMAAVLGQIRGEHILAARDAADGGIATLMHAAVVCSDDPVTAPGDMIVPPGASRFARVFGQSVLAEYLALCRAVDVPPLPDDTDIDSTADIPTLVLSGWLDVRTPTGRSLEVARALPTATLVTFWQGTHVQIAEVNTCAAGILRAFVADPTAEVDPACVEDIPPRGFVLPDFTMSVQTE